MSFKQSFALENFFETNLPRLPLPHIWQVVYHEGIRNNHFLFTDSELAKIDSHLSNGGFRLTDDDQKTVLAVTTRIFTSGDYEKIRGELSRLTDSQKSVFFILYKRTLSNWTRKLKASLH